MTSFAEEITKKFGSAVDESLKNNWGISCENFRFFYEWEKRALIRPFPDLNEFLSEICPRTLIKNKSHK